MGEQVLVDILSHHCFHVHGHLQDIVKRYLADCFINKTMAIWVIIYCLSFGFILFDYFA